MKTSIIIVWSIYSLLLILTLGFFFVNPLTRTYKSMGYGYGSMVKYAGFVKFASVILTILLFTVLGYSLSYSYLNYIDEEDTESQEDARFGFMLSGFLILALIFVYFAPRIKYFVTVPYMIITKEDPDDIEEIVGNVYKSYLSI